MELAQPPASVAMVWSVVGPWPWCSPLAWCAVRVSMQGGSPAVYRPRPVQHICPSHSPGASRVPIVHSCSSIRCLRSMREPHPRALKSLMVSLSTAALGVASFEGWVMGAWEEVVWAEAANVEAA